MERYEKWLKSMSLILCIAGLLCFRIVADANPREPANFGGYTFKAIVTSVGIDEQITVKFRNLNKGAVNKYETAKLCEFRNNNSSFEDVVTTKESILLNQRLDLLKDAMKSGRMVEVKLNSLFDRCLLGFNYIHSKL